MTLEEWLADHAEGVALGGQAERVVRVLARAPQFAAYASGREVAERAGVNVSTVVRAAQQLGFEGWPDLRQALRSVYLSSAWEGAGPITGTDPAALMLRMDSKNLNAVAAADNIASIQATAKSIRQARRTVVVATGSGSGLARVLEYFTTVCGYDVRIADGSATRQVIEVAQLDPGDCLIVINIWRLTRALRGVTRLGRDRGATVAVLTDLRSSPLAADADQVIIMPIDGIGEMPSLTAGMGVVQAILAELTSPTTGEVNRRIELAWESLDLMDDQS